MGIFGAVLGGKFGKSLGLGGSSNLGRRAAEQERIARGKANVELQSQFDISSGEIGGQQGQLREDFFRQKGQTELGFNPFIDIGQGAARNLQQSSTAGGLNALLEQIIGGGTFQSLRDEQLRANEGQLAASGLGGSGLGVQTAQQIGPQLALQLAGDLRGRQEFLSGQGFQGVGQRGQLGNQLFGTQGGLSNELTRLLSGLRQNVATGKAGNIVGSGQAASSGILADEQINTQRLNNLLNLFSTGSKAFSGGSLPTA